MCLLNSSPFVPEWVVGEMIAEKTARNTTLPIDFLKLDLPQVSMKFLKEIRVSTHINYEIKTDFITEMAKASVKPINSFTTDMTRILPTNVGKNINIEGPGNINVKVPPPKGSYLHDNPFLPKIAVSDIARDPKPLYDLLGRLTGVLEKHKDIALSTEDFQSFLQ